MNLSTNVWDALARASTDPDAVVDLSDVAYVNPPGVVALVLAARARADARLSPLRLVAPAADGVRTYLGRIDVVDRLEALGCDVAGFDDVRHHNRYASSSFTAVLDGDDGLGGVLPVLWTFLNGQLPTDTARIAYAPLIALVSNVDRHACPGGPAPASAAQVQVYTNRVELAVGDLGVGFHASLTLNPTHAGLPKDEDALRAAISGNASRYEDPRHGGDVARVVRQVRALQGGVEVRSFRGGAVAVPERVRYGSHLVPFPGTLVSIRLPRVAAD